ncbi:MAG: NAD(P)-dependent oxidoreductase [Opitutales bacterium]|jgi:UDP-glucose 4-epimerase
MEIFLTGGTGFIGSHVAVELLKRGHRITILARNPDKIPLLRAEKNIGFVKGNLADVQAIREGLQGKDACIHIALNYQEQRGWQTILDDTVPTVSMGAAAVEAGVGRFIYTSSTSVNDNLYNPANRDPEQTLLVTPAYAHSPATFYGASKAACENYLLSFSYQSKMKVNVIRPGYVFGNPVIEGAPTQGDTRFRDLARAVLADQPISLDRNDGTQFIWAGDIAKIYADLLESDLNRKIYYALSGNVVTWAEIVKEMIARSGSKTQLQITGEEPTGKGGMSWGVEGIKNDFGLAFNSWKPLRSHIEYWLKQCAKVV